MTEMVHSLAVIVLAAGRSSRMGRAKQLEVVDGEAMVVRAARLALGCGAAVTTVITGAYAEQIEQQLAQLIQTQGLQIVHNPNWAEGQATSVHAAIQSLPATIEAALFLPVDQPFVTPGFLQSVIDCWQEEVPNLSLPRSMARHAARQRSLPANISPNSYRFRAMWAAGWC